MTHHDTRSDPTTVDADSTDPVARAQRLVPEVAAAAERIEADRCLPPTLLDALHEARLFRLGLPAHVGGEAAPLPALAAVTETIAAADASTAWCLGQAIGCAMAAAFLDPEPARTVFGPDNAVLAWGAGIQGEARETDHGYRAHGQWRFASGGHHATWLGAHCHVTAPDGTARLNADGRKVDRTMLLPRSEATIADDWHVTGLRGTRSEGYSVDQLHIPAAYTLDRESRDECRDDAPLFRFPTTSVYASVFSGVALGIARGALDDLTTLARNKKARGAATALRDSPVFLTQLAELEARHAAARAFQRGAVERAWDGVSGGRDPDLELRIDIRLATTHAIRECTTIVEQVWRMAGSDAIFESGPFERRFRDMHAVSQQVQGRETNLETVGRHLMGQRVPTTFL